MTLVERIDDEIARGPRERPRTEQQDRAAEEEEEVSSVEAGQVFRHYKGNIYMVLAVADYVGKHGEIPGSYRDRDGQGTVTGFPEGEKLVIYVGLYDNPKGNRACARPLKGMGRACLHPRTRRNGGLPALHEGLVKIKVIKPEYFYCLACLVRLACLGSDPPAISQRVNGKCTDCGNAHEANHVPGYALLAWEKLRAGHRDFQERAFDVVTGRAVAVEGYPVARQGTTLGDCSEIECPSCGVANDVTDEDGVVYPGDRECRACDAPFEVHDVTVIARTRRTIK